MAFTNDLSGARKPTDRMADIVRRHIERSPGIEFAGRPKKLDRSFAGKGHAFNAGYEAIKDVPYEIFGNLDADSSFDSDYFAFRLTKFSQDPGLGVAGKD